MYNTAFELRPLGVSDIVDRAFFLYRRNFRLLITTSAIVLGPSTVLLGFVYYGLFNALNSLQQATTSSAYNGETSGAVSGLAVQLFGLLGLAFVLVGVEFVGLYIVNAAVTAIASYRYLGREITVGRAYGLAFRRLPSLLGFVFCQTLALTIPFVPIAVLIVAGAVAASRSATSGTNATPGAGLALFGTFCLGGLLGLAAFIYAIFMGIRWSVTAQIITIETAGPVHGLSRSWRLTRGNFWRAFLVVGVTTIIISIAGQVPSSIVSQILNLSGQPIAGAAASVIVSQAAQIALVPFEFIVLTIFYYDLRVRKEGLDLDLQAVGIQPAGSAFGQAMIPPGAPGGYAAPPPLGGYGQPGPFSGAPCPPDSPAPTGYDPGSYGLPPVGGGPYNAPLGGPAWAPPSQPPAPQPPDSGEGRPPAEGDERR